MAKKEKKKRKEFRLIFSGLLCEGADQQGIKLFELEGADLSMTVVNLRLCLDWGKRGEDRGREKCERKLRNINFVWIECESLTSIPSHFLVGTKGLVRR